MRKYTLLASLLLCLPLLSVAQDTLRLSMTGYNAKCNGRLNGSAKATPSGGAAPYTYVWTPAAGTTDSIGGLAAGTYSVTVTDSDSNVVSGSVIISQPDPLTVTIDSIVVPPCFRTTSAVCGCANTLWAVVSGGTPPYTYSWSPGSSSTTSSTTSDTLQYACYLEFTVIVTDSNQCVSSDSLNVVIPYSAPPTAPMGVGQLSNSEGINTYPNPATSQLNISIDESAGSITSLAVYDMTGNEVLAQQPTNSGHLVTIDISGLAAGNYLLKVASDQSQKATHFSVLR